MAEDAEVAAVWRYSTLLAYHDPARGAPMEQAQRLVSMGSRERSVAIAAVELTVADHAAALDEEDLVYAAVTMIEHLYRAGHSLMMWSPDIHAYVAAVWGTFYASLAKRGYRLHYVVAHPFERLGRPLELFPDLFRAAGVHYVCPHLVANHLPAAAETEVSHEGLAPFLDEARIAAVAEARAAAAAREHLAYLEVDFRPGVLDEVVALGGTAGTIRVLRNQPPGAESVPQVTVTPP